MINIEEFKGEVNDIIDWICDYYSNIENFPVRSVLNYGDIKSALPNVAPHNSESFKLMMNDFKNIILPGITHWQNPKFFAYFPANSSIPSLEAEILTAALGVQGMKWITSPAATELEEVVMDWLRKLIALPDNFKGVIGDTASVANLCALLTARERFSNQTINMNGFNGSIYRVYCSIEAHSSIEKAVRIAGIGSSNLVKIEVDKQGRMLPEILEERIKRDLKLGYFPLCLIGAMGTTGTCAIDPIDHLALIAEKYNIWFHIDAAFAGSALILPEFRERFPNLEKADSLVFNPHKWLFTNFDCTAFFVKDPGQLQETFRLVPGYLETTSQSEANDFSNWGIQLGRRFRSLKLWFVIRRMGVEGIQKKLREHIQLADLFAKGLINTGIFELVVPVSLSVVVFQLKLKDKNENTNNLNARLLETINQRGNIFLSHTLFQSKFVLRLVCAQTNVQQKHIDEALYEIEYCAKQLINSNL